MPLTQNFTATQSLSILDEITITDTSTGTDDGLTSRRVTVTLADGTTLVEDGVTTSYNVWPIDDIAITLSLLTKSQVANVKVDWMTGDVVTYTKTLMYVFDLYDYIFLYGLTQLQTANPTIVNNKTYYDNKIKMIVNLDDAENAVVYASDIFSAQSSLDRNALMIANESMYF